MPRVSGWVFTMASPSAKREQEATEDANTSSFLGQVYQLAESHRERLAATRIMEYVDGLLREGGFDVCGRLLSRVDVLRLSKHPTLLVAFLGITLGAKNQLAESRREFYSRAQAALDRELGPDRVERILCRFQ